MAEKDYLNLHCSGYIGHSISYLAHRAIVEEEAGADTGTHSPRHKVRTQPAQNTLHHQCRASTDEHCCPAILSNHILLDLTTSTVSSWLMHCPIPVGLALVTVNHPVNFCRIVLPGK